MNIRFKHIDIQNFRSIDRAQITLNDQGTIVVKGINEYEDKATSNGSGKSSIFEAIIFALYEETSSGEKDVENRIIKDSYSVVLEFEINGDIYTINRQGKSGKSSVILLKNKVDISARNKTDTNKLIISLLGINKQIFLDSIFLSQNAVTNLASLPPTSRKERLEILSNTDSAVNSFKEKMKQKQLEYEANCVTSQQEISTYNGNISALNNQIFTLQNKINEARAEIERKKALGSVEQIDAEIDNLQLSIMNNTKQIETLNIEIQNLEDNITHINQRLTDIATEKDEIQKQVYEIQSNISSLNYKSSNIDKDINLANIQISQIENQIKSIKESDTCPTCGRKYENIDENHINELIKTHAEEINNHRTNIINLNKDKENLSVEIVTLNQQNAEITEKLNQQNDLINQVRQELSNYETDKRTAQYSKDNLNNLILSTNNTILELQNKKSELVITETNAIKEYEDMITDINNQINEIGDRKVLSEGEYNKYNDLIQTIKHSISLITKDFRTFLLQNSIAYLNKLLIDYSSRLFSNNTDIIKIEDKDNKLDIKLGDATYESLSGGEKTRVNIALLLAQKSLASMVGNITCNMIILDEILGYCDSEAESNVISLIIDELDSLETIYMISHKEIPIPYDSELIVIKDKQGLSHVQTR